MLIKYINSKKNEADLCTKNMKVSTHKDLHPNLCSGLLNIWWQYQGGLWYTWREDINPQCADDIQITRVHGHNTDGQIFYEKSENMHLYEHEWLIATDCMIGEDICGMPQALSSSVLVVYSLHSNCIKLFVSVGVVVEDSRSTLFNNKYFLVFALTSQTIKCFLASCFPKAHFS